jgi:glycosyltransferase involved in cell wall biosynthesis
MKVLWFTSWYPAEISPYNGDFIQRHARAASLFNEVEVLYVEKDAAGLMTQDVKEIINNSGQLTERIIYYKPFKTYIPILDRFLSNQKYKRLYRRAVKNYIRTNGKPAFVHTHIAMKAGLVALWLKRKFNIPYILSEQWGGYMDTAKPNVKDYNAIYQHYWNKIFKEAMTCTFVSAELQRVIKQKYKVENSQVIPNVVDTGIFFPVPTEPAEGIRLIHISTMTYQKNTEAILQALHLIKNEIRFRMDLYGTMNPVLQQLIIELQLQDKVFAMGEVPQPQLAKAIQRSDALVLYSRYETFGCVLIEANACGVPVIVSDLAVFHELIREGENGLFAAGENAVLLAEKIKMFLNRKDTFNKQAIAATAAATYNFRKIGKQFADLYTDLFV